MKEIYKRHKNKIMDVLVTAFLSAGIAFFQSLLASNGGHIDPAHVATTAGILGFAFRSPTLG